MVSLNHAKISKPFYSTAADACDDNAGNVFSLACAIVFFWKRLAILSSILPDVISETDDFYRHYFWVCSEWEKCTVFCRDDINFGGYLLVLMLVLSC